MSIPEHLRFKPSAGIPNNPDLPVLIYRAALPADPGRIEDAINANDWECRWRNGIFDYHHFHSTAHETLGIARGTAQVLIGGEGGAALKLTPGDVVVLPAGTGHRRLEASVDFLVVGAYPLGQDYEIERPSANGLDDALARIRAVALPDGDPVEGREGPLMQLWKV